ncbi:uncharacterized protein LOC132945598 [Metopolophium dirhodum]|uniref:uncharacterized protein LOC132945598 n=1 Tax=Metopolophium dirhodum TaxID=44670 RepID=UPI0029906B30|nr:uncharacterized protein LOC132945598 [Metopolophium dirhodum]
MLEREFFSRFGYPRVCLSDNGPQFVANDMRKAIEQWGAEGWTTPLYHLRANPVRRRNQELKKGLRALLVDGNYNTWDTKLAPILFSIRNRRNDRTGYPPSVLVLGREGKRPGDWILPRTVDNPIEQINMDRVSHESDVLIASPVTGGPTDTKYKTGDMVYYKAHHLSNAHKKFHAGFAPKWWGPVKVCLSQTNSQHAKYMCPASNGRTPHSPKHPHPIPPTINPH